MMAPRLVFSCMIVFLIFSGTAPASPDLSLESSSAILVWNEQGLSVQPKISGPSVAGHPNPVWSLLLIESDGQSALTGRRVTIEDRNQVYHQKKTEQGYELFYPRLKNNDESFDISLLLKIIIDGDAFRIDAVLENHTTDWIATDVTGPVLNGIQADLKEYPILWPQGLGIKAGEAVGAWPWRKKGDDLVLSGTYPAVEFNMQYITFAGKESGLWIGSPDEERAAKKFEILYAASTKTLKASICHFSCVPPGSIWKKTLVEILPYRGDWHTAADYYRQRCSGWMNAGRQKPDWVNDATGMFLVIMNQQKNRHAMWRYDQIGAKMTDDAFAQGFNMIGLFGWHKGGHDVNYPVFEPDELLGGREALKKGIAAAQARGQKVCLYSNGQLIDDELTGVHKNKTEKLAVVNRDGSKPSEVWTIFDDIEGHSFGRACLLSEEWCKIMLDLAKDANDLGADGILYDQIAVGGPMPCYSPNHGHPVPAMTHGASGAMLMRRVQDEMKKINPEFIVLTEGFNDASLDSCSFYHSIGTGVYGTPALNEIRQWRDGEMSNGLFRPLFPYTWPEASLTIRNPIPLQHRRASNMACFLGLKNEVEVRFPADVETLSTGRLPAMSRYKQDHLSPSRVNTLKLAEFAGRNTLNDMTYTKMMNDFRLKYRDLLLAGRFRDTVGFISSGKVLAAAFEAKNRFGVLVWNPEEEPVSFSVEVPGKKLMEAGGPENGIEKEPFSPLSGNSVRLLIWK